MNTDGLIKHSPITTRVELEAFVKKQLSSGGLLADDGQTITPYGFEQLWQNPIQLPKGTDLRRIAKENENKGLVRIYLPGVRLSGTDLRDLNMEGACLDGACFLEACLVRSQLKEASLRGASFLYADCTDTHFDSADLSGAMLNSANLCGAKMRGASLDEASLENVHLSHACFDNAQLNQASFKEARGEKVSFIGAKLRDADFKNASLSEVNFSQAMLGKASFICSNLPLANFERAKLQAAQFDFANCVDANFREADLRGASLQMGIFQEAQFINAKLQEVCLGEGANFWKANFTGADCDGMDFHVANLEGVNLEEARNVPDNSEAIRLKKTIGEARKRKSDTAVARLLIDGMSGFSDEAKMASVLDLVAATPRFRKKLVAGALVVAACCVGSGIAIGRGCFSASESIVPASVQEIDQPNSSTLAPSEPPAPSSKPQTPASVAPAKGVERK